MKKYTIPLCVLILTALFLTGCGCRNSAPMDTVPTTLPTMETTRPTTEATAAPTTETTRPTESTASTEETIDNGNGPLPTNESNSGNENSRTRRFPDSK